MGYIRKRLSAFTHKNTSNETPAANQNDPNLGSQSHTPAPADTYSGSHLKINDGLHPASPLKDVSGQPLTVKEGDMSLFVNLTECKNLKAADLSGTSDPYCVLSLDGKEKERSETIMKTLNPVFNTVFSVALPLAQQYPREVTLTFWDWDLGPGKDDFLGQVVIPIKDIPIIESPSQKVETAEPSGVKGKLDKKSSFLRPRGKAPEPYWMPVAQRKKGEKVTGDAHFSIWIGRKDDFHGAGHQGTTLKEPLFRYIKVQVKQARNLLAADKTGTSDPYVELRLGEQKVTTKSKRCELNPVWNEQFMFVTEDGLKGKTLTMDVMDWDDTGSNDELGGISFDLGELEKSEKGLQAFKDNMGKIETSWHTLRFKSESKPCQGELQVGIQIQEGYRHDLMQRPKLGNLCVRVIQAKNLHKTSAVDTPDPYIVMRYADTWMRSATKKDTIYPQFDCSMEFDVYEVSNILTVAVFDDNNMKHKSLKEKLSTFAASKDALLGKVNVPLNCLLVNKPYRSMFTLFVRRKNKIQVFGELELELVFRVPEANQLGFTVNLLKAYKNPLLPDKYYYEPPSDVDMKRLNKTRNALIVKHLGSQTPVGIRKEACEAVFAASGMEEFKMFRLKMRMARIKAFKNVMGPLVEYVVVAMKHVFSWKYPVLTILFDVVWVFICFNSHMVLPGIFLMLCMASLAHLVAKNFNKPPMATVELLEGIDSSSQPDDGDIDTESEAANKNPIKALKMKIETMQGHALKVQDAIGSVACTLEQVESILSWDSAIGSFVFFVCFFMMFAVTYTIPLRYLMAMGGVGLTIKKHPKISDPLPAAPVNLFKRLPSQAHFML